MTPKIMLRGKLIENISNFRDPIYFQWPETTFGTQYGESFLGTL